MIKVLKDDFSGGESEKEDDIELNLSEAEDYVNDKK